MTEIARPSGSPSPASPFLAWVGELVLLAFSAFGAVLRGRILFAETLRQMAVIGVQSIPITLVTLGFSGMVLALHTANTLKRLGVEGLVGGIVAVTMARE